MASTESVIAATAVLHEGVELGHGSTVGEFVLLGAPARGFAPGDRPTILGTGATIRSHSVVYAGTRIGSEFECGHGCLIREECEIGSQVSVGSHSVVEFQVRIADGVRIHSQAFVPEHSVLEAGCWIGPNVVLTNAKFPQGKDAKQRLVGVIVGRNAKLGANATVLPGVRLGEACLVGAGAVVTKDVPARAVVVGNPARFQSWINELQEDGLSPYADRLLRLAG